MNYTAEDICIVILSRDKEHSLVLAAALRATGLKIKAIRPLTTFAAAEKFYKKKIPAVVFFDAAMGVDGEFRGLTLLNRNIPLIVITEKKDPRTGYAFLEKGATDFFRKSSRYDPVLLEKSVRFSMENKISAESLRLSNERYELVSKATSDMVWDWDLLKNKVFRSAEGWSKVFGNNSLAESNQPDSWWERVHPEDTKKCNAVLERVLKSKTIQNFEIECRILRDDSNYATVVDRGFVIRNENGDVTRLIGATHDITEKKLVETNLAAERRVRQNEITNAVITAQERERESLGNELHDNINQILATGKLYIEYALTNDAMRTELLGKAKKLIEGAVNELRNLSKSLLPPSLGAVGLLMALKELIESIEPVNSFKVKTDWDGTNEKLLPETLKLTVFRIIQEQLNNISKHAKAKKVYVKLRADKTKLTLVVRDDGVGFRPTQKVTGVGLKNIFSRAQLNNGKAGIVSEKGKGTTLTVQFKL